ncbi:MAG: hypothetical protein DMG75_13200, partial [Acidobacteria bacterium]
MVTAPCTGTSRAWSRSRLPVLIVPVGSGNDFARALNLRSIRDSLAAFKRFASDAANVWTVDLG